MKSQKWRQGCIFTNTRETFWICAAIPLILLISRETITYEKILVAKELERQNLSKIFGDKFLNVVKTVNMFAEIKSWNDYDLLLIYSTLIDCLIAQMKKGKRFSQDDFFEKIHSGSLVCWVFQFL